MKDGAYASIPRVDYNYFVDASGLGGGPYTLRVIDVHDHVVEDSGIVLGERSRASAVVSSPRACETKPAHSDVDVDMLRVTASRLGTKSIARSQQREYGPPRHGHRE